MATYVSKFNLSDTAYSVDSTSLSLTAVVITDIRVRESLNFPAVTPRYLVSYRGRSNSSQKDYSESELYYLDEGKVALEALIAAKLTAIKGAV